MEQGHLYTSHSHHLLYADPPYFLVTLGLAIAVVCGLTFSKQIQLKLDGWREDRLPMLPLGVPTIVAPYLGTLLGIILFIGGALMIFSFAAGTSLLVALVLSLLTGGGLWRQLETLMRQVEAGSFRAVDFDNVDNFF